MSVPWCSCHSKGKCKEIRLYILSSSFSKCNMYPFLFILFLLTFLSAMLCVTRCSMWCYFLTQETHGAYQIISQMAAQMTIWWVAVCCDTATKAQANPDTLSCNCCTIFFLLQLMEWIKSQINKINIASVARVYWFSTLLSCYQRRIWLCNLAGL